MINPYFFCPLCNKKLRRGISSIVSVSSIYSPAVEMYSMDCQLHHFSQTLSSDEHTSVLSVKVSLGLIETRNMKSTMGLEYQADFHDTLTITNYYQTDDLPSHSTISRLPSTRFQVNKPFLLTILPDQQTINANTLHLDQIFELDFPTLEAAIKRARTALFFN
jgi:hypothetical protein